MGIVSSLGANFRVNECYSKIRGAAIDPDQAPEDATTKTSSGEHRERNGLAQAISLGPSLLMDATMKRAGRPLTAPA